MTTLPMISARRRRTDVIMRWLMGAATLVALVPLVLVLYYLFHKGLSAWSGDFFTTDPNGNFLGYPGGVRSAILGTIEIVALASLISIPIGIGVALYLTEYGKDSWFANVVRYFVDVMTGVPSIVFGLFGFGLFVIFFGWNVSLIAGWFTLGLMILPAIITASEESLRAVPKGLREGSLALGATSWQTIRKNVLPYAMPGILTSSILGIARVAGETAPIMFTAAYAMRDEMPWQVPKWTDFFFQGVMALPYHIYVVSSKIPQNEYTERVQYGTVFVFLVVVMLIALASIVLRERQRRRLSW